MYIGKESGACKGGDGCEGGRRAMRLIYSTGAGMIQWGGSPGEEGRDVGWGWRVVLPGEGYRRH